MSFDAAHAATLVANFESGATFGSVDEYVDQLRSALEEIGQLKETLQFMRTYSGFEARPCALCVYRDGVFLARCSLHAIIDELEFSLDMARRCKESPAPNDQDPTQAPEAHS